MAKAFPKNATPKTIMNIIWSGPIQSEDEKMVEALMNLSYESLWPIYQLILTRDLTRDEFYQDLRTKQLLIEAAQKKEGVLMATLPSLFRPFPNPGQGDCLFASIGQALEESAVQIRNWAAEAPPGYLLHKQAQVPQEYASDPWFFLSSFLLVSSPSENQLLENIRQAHPGNPEQQQQVFQELLKKPQLIWGSHFYIEILQLHPRFANLNIALFNLNDPIGSLNLPHIRCFTHPTPTTPHQKYRWLLILMTTTSGTSSGGKHFELLLLKKSTEYTYRPVTLKNALYQAGYWQTEGLANEPGRALWGCITKIHQFGVPPSPRPLNGSTTPLPPFKHFTPTAMSILISD